MIPYATLPTPALEIVITLIGTIVAGFYIGVGIYLKAFTKPLHSKPPHTYLIFLGLGFAVFALIHGARLLPDTMAVDVAKLGLILLIGVLGVEYVRQIIRGGDAATPRHRLHEIFDEIRELPSTFSMLFAYIYARWTGKTPPKFLFRYDISELSRDDTRLDDVEVIKILVRGDEPDPDPENDSDESSSD